MKEVLRYIAAKFSIIIYRSVVIVLFISLSFGLYAKDLRISLYDGKGVISIMFTPVSGEYEIVSNNIQITRIIKNEIVQISMRDGLILVKDISNTFGSFKSIQIRSLSKVSAFRIKPIMPSLEARNYEGDLEVSYNSILHLINKINIERYIAGVVEAEGGPASPLEYYKSQALLCRTYAYGHLKRHEDEGFQLCDDVHCQAYHGMSNNKADIELACATTAGQIIVDKNNKIITAAYHSNCGGETVNSENAWTFPLPYLKSIQEDYCKQAPHSKWEANVKTVKWSKYLKEHGFKNIDKLSSIDYKYTQEGRQLYYSIGGDSIKLKDIRRDWGFKSTYFSIIPIDDELYFKGIGYGHGVGLCQEGAMEMARKGKNYKEILQHYYKGVKIIVY